MDRWQKTEDPSSPDGFRLRSSSFAETSRRGTQMTEGRKNTYSLLVIGYSERGIGKRLRIGDWEKHREWGKWN